MHYVGVDYHKQTSHVTVLDGGGKIVTEVRIPSERAALAAVLEEIDGEKAAVLEAGREWSVMYGWLEELVDTVTLAHPAKVRVIAEAKIKTDRLDARRLAQLLRMDWIPAAYVPGKVTQQQRRQLRQRMFLVRLCTMLKNRIHILLDRHPEVRRPVKEGSDLFGKAGRAWLAQVVLPAEEAALLQQNLAVLAMLEREVKASDAWVRQLARTDPRAQRLMTIPGIGAFFAVLLTLEIDDIHRFSRAQKLCAYAGLVPSTYASGSYVHHGRITKRGNKWIRWACIEAVYPALRKDPALAELYTRLKAGKGANVAKVAVAKRLLTIVYRVLLEERTYRAAEEQLRRRFSAAPVCA